MPQSEHATAVTIVISMPVNESLFSLGSKEFGVRLTLSRHSCGYNGSVHAYTIKNMSISVQRMHIYKNMFNRSSRYEKNG